MFICGHANVERKHYTKRDPAVQREIIGKEDGPRFLVQALGWVEFRRIALQRELHYLSDSSSKDAGEPRADIPFGLLP